MPKTEKGETAAPWGRGRGVERSSRCLARAACVGLIQQQAHIACISGRQFKIKYIEVFLHVLL
jgi:hypothetical protein